METDLYKPLEDYISFFEHLSPRAIPLMGQVVHDLVHFTDPFNDVCGLEAMQAVFKKAYADVDDLKFKVQDYAWGQSGHVAYLKWRCDFTRKGSANHIIGMSEIHFADNGKVIAHYDFWDSGTYVYEKIPILRNIIQFIKRKLSV